MTERKKNNTAAGRRDMRYSRRSRPLAAEAIEDAVRMMTGAHGVQHWAALALEEVEEYRALTEGRAADMPQFEWHMWVRVRTAMRTACNAVWRAEYEIGQAYSRALHAVIGTRPVDWPAKTQCRPLSAYWSMLAERITASHYTASTASGDTCGPAGQYIVTPADMLTEPDRCALIEGKCA